MKYIVVFMLLFFFLLIYSSCLVAGKASLQEEREEYNEYSE